MISGGIFDVAHKQSSLEDINNRLSDESTWSNLELSQSLNKEKADLEKFLNSFLSVDEAINDNLDFLDIAIEESDDGSIEEINEEYKDLFKSLVISSHKALIACLYDARYSILTVILAGFGRAISEVGAVIIVGGNIDHLTRVMTTTIALETSKGNLSLALALGIILLLIALIINLILISLKTRAKRRMYV